jgi:hypothetical protein
MTAYRRRPADVRAAQVDLSRIAELVGFLDTLSARVEAAMLPGPGRGVHPGVRIHTLDDVRTASVGDWVVITGPRTYRVIPADQFADEYEETR